jgi:5-methylcytosine-specific restriction endonuclease McrA
MIPQGIITAAIERLQSGRLSKAERRAALILGGGSVHAPKKALVLPGKTKTERKAERFDRLAAIRTGVFARAERERGLRCEWYCERVACELHHIEQGGARRSLEAVENCAAICTECHRAYHRNDLDTLRSAATWAVEHEFRDAARTIARRLAKIEDVRAGRASLGKERVTR